MPGLYSLTERQLVVLLREVERVSSENMKTQAVLHGMKYTEPFIQAPRTVAEDAILRGIMQREFERMSEDG